MIDDISICPRDSARASVRHRASVTDLATRRREENVLSSITVVFGGVNYGTIPIRAPYAAGRPIALYLVPSDNTAHVGDDVLHGLLECLITDDVELALDKAR